MINKIIRRKTTVAKKANNISSIRIQLYSRIENPNTKNEDKQSNKHST